MGVLLVVSLLVGHRCLRAPIAPYGDFGAEYLEHEVRVAQLAVLQEGPVHGWADFLGELDREFPPLMHLLTQPLAQLLGNTAEAISWTGLLWLLGLALLSSAIARRLGGSKRAGTAAFVGILLIPALQGYATRYYYDLPMVTVLWAAVLVALATWDRRPLLGGAAVTALVVAAVLTKWTALALAPLLLLPALAAASARAERPVLRWRPRLLALGLTVLLSLAAIHGLADLLGADSSLAIMLNDMWPGLGTAFYGPGSPSLASMLLWLGERGGVPTERALGADLSFYPLALVTSVLSPLLALFTAGFILRWIAGSRRGLPLLLGTVLLQWLFLAGLLNVLDERFLVPLVPALVIAAALGWSELSAPLRKGLAIATCGAALLASLDFHYSLPTADLPSHTVASYDSTRRGEPLDLELRLLGISDSFEQRGWSRWDGQGPSRTEAHQLLWEAIRDCGAKRILLTEAEPSQRPLGSLHWLQYAIGLAQVQGQAMEFEAVDGAYGGPYDLVVGPQAAAGDRPEWLGDDWSVFRTVPLTEQERGAVFWAPAGRPGCPGGEEAP